MNEMDGERRGRERFVAAALITGTFAGAQVSFENMSLSGVQILHSEMFRIGLKARLAFRGVDTEASLQAHVTWSHLSQEVGGSSIYHSGLELDGVDAHYALALNELIRTGGLIADRKSLHRRRHPPAATTPAAKPPE